MAGTALEEDEEGPICPARISDLAGEDLDLLAVGSIMVQRDLELVLGEEQAGSVNHDGHDQSV
jgi:hypothetical protein